MIYIPNTIDKEINFQKHKILTDSIKNLDITELPDDVIISTITIVCRIGDKQPKTKIFNCKNIAKYIELRDDCILTVTHGIKDDTATNRTIIQSKKKKNKTKKVFFNQVSLAVKINGKPDDPVNIKLFANGAIQMTGCKNISNAVETMYIVFEELKKQKAIISPENNKITDIPFVSDMTLLSLDNIKNFKIAMINSGFKIPFRIDRVKLHDLLMSKNHDCLCELVRHACVNIKYNNSDDENNASSIFVFEKGSIIITGVKSGKQINNSYNFINRFLLENHKAIKKNDNLRNINIINFLNNSDAENITSLSNK